MPTNDQTIAQLHQRASSHYLQGEFGEALTAWRDLLRLDSTDERALEGVRLCELLSDQGSGAQTLSQAPQAASAEQPVELVSPVDQPVNTDLPDPAIQGEGIDMGDLASLETLPLVGSAEPLPEVESPADDLNFEFDIPEPQPLTESPVVTETVELPAAPVEPDPASAQLQARIDELYAEALAAYEQGQPEAAMGLLCRLFILDEQNELGLALQEKIQVNTEAAATAVPPPVPESAPAPEAPAEDLLGDVSFDPPAPALQADPADLELDDSDLEGPPLGAPAVAPVPSVDADSEEFEESVESEVQPVAPVSTPRAARRGIAVPKGLAIALSGVALAAVGVFVWLQFGGSADTASAQETDNSIAALKDMTRDESAPSAEGGEVVAENAAAVDPQPEDVPLLGIDELLARGAAALDVQDYAGAVLAYNQILEIDPSNTEATTQLAVAGKYYREQREREQKWAEAIRSFNDENYRGALHALYRVESDDVERHERYKRNSWYNMALMSLRSGDCRSAKSNFEEAQAIDPADEDVASGLELASLCRKDPHFSTKVSSRRLRGLDD